MLIFLFNKSPPSTVKNVHCQSSLCFTQTERNKAQSEQCSFVAEDLGILRLFGEWFIHKCYTASVAWNFLLLVYPGAAWTSIQHRYYVSVPAVDRQGIIQPLIGYSYQHTVFALHVFSQCTSFSCWLRSDTGGIAMAEKVDTQWSAGNCVQFRRKFKW